MESNRQKWMDILLSNPQKVFFYWNCVHTSWQVFGDYIPRLDSKEINPLKSLIEGELICQEDRELFRIYLTKIENGMQDGMPEDSLQTQCHIKTRDGYQLFKIKSCFRRDEQRRILEVAGILEPMSAIETMQRDQLFHQLMRDTPRIFARAVREQFAKYPNDKFAFIQFDINKFKIINAQYGEDFGTEVLRNILNFLEGICDGEQLHTRLAGDVFMAVVRYEDKEQLVEFIYHMEEELNHYKDVSYTLTFGVYLVVDKTMEIRQMGDSAALARRSIKGNALQSVAFFQGSMESALYTRKFIEDNMKKALREGQFVMYLQPKYSISTNRVIGAEALVRWMHPEKGMITPMNFIPVFEENTFIIKLDEYIWEQACRTIRGWMDEHKTPVPISVNVSRVHLRRNQIYDTLRMLLEQYRIPKELLELEITESEQSTDIDDAACALKEEGYTLLMDDFGSGASSLNTLKNTPFDVVKIDKEFLNHFIESERGQKIIAHTIRMTKDIGLDLIAEGVETKEQADFLQECGCDAAQGYYYAKPMPLEDFNKLIS